MMIRYILALVLVIFAMGTGMKAGAASQERSIVILGASYAKDWGTPKLPGYSRVINRGAGGEETGDMLKRFSSDVGALKPDAVLIWGHVNNITRSPPEGIAATKAAAHGHYTEMLRQARAAGIEPIFATEVPWTESPGIVNQLKSWVGYFLGKESYAKRVSGHIRELNDFLRNLASSEHLLLLDFEHVLAPDGGTREPEFTAADGSHISEAGYAALTAYAIDEMRRAASR